MIFAYSIICLFCSSCATMKTGFYQLEYAKEREVMARFGNGTYYRFMAKGSDVREVRKNYELFEGIKKLVENTKEKPEKCIEMFKIIPETYVFSKGGSISIFIRCEQ